jgi:hypothetical protein
MTEHTSFSNDDEALSALIDGTLAREEAAALHGRLEREPELAARLAAMERANRAVREAYRRVVDEPLPQRTLDLLRAPARGDNVVALAPRRALPAWFPHALAAGIALAVGLGLGFGVGQRASEPAALFAASGSVEAGSPLYELLESVPSGAPRALDSTSTAEARLTFRTIDGDWCRELAVSSTAANNSALACRRGGEWRIELLGVAPAGGELYRPAGAEAPFQEAVDALIDGEALEPAAERALLEGGWPRD